MEHYSEQHEVEDGRMDPFSQDHGTALHWAAFQGKAELVRLLLRHGLSTENADNPHKSTPLGWAIHGSMHGWHPDEGDYAGCVESLLKAGAKPPKEIEGSEAVQAVLQRYQ